jgi:PAS domain S-box-containing protein
MIDLYRQLFDEIPCYVSAQDREFHIVAANRLFRKDFVIEPGAHCYEAYKGRSDKCPNCPVELTFQDGQTHRSEELVTRKDGEVLNVIVYTSPICDPDGKISAVVEISADITKVKKLQEKYYTLFDEVPCYISVQDRNLKIVEANSPFKRDFGEGIGSHCFEVYKHRTEPCVVCPVAETFQDGEINQSEEVVTSQNGKQINVLCQAAAIRNATGEITSVMEISTNITELRQLQSQLTSLGLMVSSVSHGLKGLLSGLDGGIYLMDTGFKKDNMERVKEGWNMMRRNVDGIRSMVMNILYYAKEREVLWQPIDLTEVVSSVVKALAGRAEMFGIDLRMESAAGFFEGDRHSVHSLLVNLVENSIDACRIDKKGIAHQVRISSSFDDGMVVFEIADNGIGMDRETKEKAFSLFFSSKGAEGTGLGLFIAYKIVKSHHGTIDIESSPGAGTRFIVRLTRKRPVPPPGDQDVRKEG